MGLELLTAVDSKWSRQEEWGRLVLDHVNSTKEIARRTDAAKRVKLYRDDYQQLLSWRLSQIFLEPRVFQRIERLIPLIGGSSFLKRVADELGRPLYAAAPMRRVINPSGKEDKGAQEAYAAICRELELNAKMGTVARLMTVCNDMHAFVRYVESTGALQLDVMTPDMLSVFTHPDVPTRPLAIAYVRQWHNDKPHEWVVWDDTRYFTVGPRGGLRDLKPHDFGMIPFLDVHKDGRTGCYWQETLGADLVAQTEQSMFLDLVGIKKVQSQSHRQLTYIGDSDAFVKDQVVDEHSVIHAESGNIGAIDLESDPGKIANLKTQNEVAVAANYGISRDRLNQQTTTATDDSGLQERVAELAAILAPAEARLFTIARAVSREHPTHKGKIPDDAQVLVDLGQIHNRVDRKTQLDVRQTERSMGLRSGVDDVLEDNPEMGGDREQAMRHIREKMAEEAIIVEERRALNAPADGGTPGEPGQSPQANGAMGPAVRDGAMTKDEAAAAGKSGTDPKLKALAMRVLRGEYAADA